MHALARKMLAGGAHVLGGHPQPATAHGCLRIIEAFGHRHAQPTAADAQVHRLEDAFAAMLQHHVTAGDAQVGRAVLHVGGHVAGPHDQQPQAGIIGGQDQLTAVGCLGIKMNAARRQQVGGIVEDPAFGQCQGQHRCYSLMNGRALGPGSRR